MDTQPPTRTQRLDGDPENHFVSIQDSTTGNTGRTYVVANVWPEDGPCGVSISFGITNMGLQAGMDLSMTDLDTLIASLENVRDVVNEAVAHFEGRGEIRQEAA